MLADEISNWIRQKVQETGSRGVVVGLSGGVDSSVVGVLARRALGDNALGLIMPCHSRPEDEECANLVAAQFGLRTQRVDLAGVYDALLSLLPTGSQMALANLKPRLRMLTLYYFANCHGYLVAGTGNKSELMVGYFTKYGDGGVDLLPLGGLLKTQVRELARQMGIPPIIIERPPTAGLWEGQTDEGEMGISYAELDRTITAMEKDDTSACSPDLLQKARAMHAASQHKRALPPIFLPRNM